uniref:Uncharacterized protein n=1 Tax=Laurenciella marilzae TaxID=1413812 RepID=A0A1Z1M1W8_9FLOR|nr:hypothetical protein [Laurenciella marilzae]ARW59773.1 hypothetical protein [Laurenciella marilzae]
MTLSLDFITEYFTGKWFTQLSTYLVNTHKQELYLKDLDICITKIQNKNYIISKNYQSIAINISNETLNRELQLHKVNHLNNTIYVIFDRIEDNLFKINYTITRSKYTYEEYLYLINQNLMFSIGILRNKYNYGYYGIITTSYIKLKD